MAQNRKQNGQGERPNKRSKTRFPYADRPQHLAAALRKLPNHAATAKELHRVLKHMPMFNLPEAERTVSGVLRQAPAECAALGIVRDGLLIKLVSPKRRPKSASRDGKDTRPRSARPTPGNPLQFFKPKSSADYLALMQARVLTKSRSHEKLIERYGLWVASRGFRPSTSEHPRDIVIRRRGEVWLTEAKVVYRGNATQAVRAAIGQLLTYQHMLPGKPTGLLALFSENIGVAYSRLLASLGVASVWWDAGSWRGSPQAINSDLAE